MVDDLRLSMNILLQKIAVASFSAFKSKGRVLPRENEWTEREAQGVGRDMSCPRKLFLNQRKSDFRQNKDFRSSKNISFVDMTFPKGWTESLPLCSLVLSWCYIELLVLIIDCVFFFSFLFF